MIRNWGLCDLPTRNGIGKLYRHYIAWSRMIERCYCPKYQGKNPTYIGCSVDERWRSASAFAEWFCDFQAEHYNDFVGKLDLDKDLLIHGNKIYSPETCLLVPHWLNTLFIDCKAIRGEWPVGVSFSKHAKKFQANIRHNMRQKYLGIFDDPHSAHLAWRKAKTAIVQEVIRDHENGLPAIVRTALGVHLQRFTIEGEE